MLIPSWCVLISYMVVTASSVLDPSLYLVPSPPLQQTSAGISPGRLWTLTRVQRHADDLAVIPIQKVNYKPNIEQPLPLRWYICQSSLTSSPTPTASETFQESTTATSQGTSEISSTVSYVLSPKTLTTPSIASSPTTEAEESMEKTETFWPNFRTQGFGYGNIHVPLTFSISGAYSRYGSRDNIGPVGVGLIGSSYGSVSDDGGIFGGYGRSGLAGSSYGSYGTRIYGGSSNIPSWSGWGNGKWGHYGKG